MIPITPLPLSFFVDRLDRRAPFAFVRYGDGEFLCLTGAAGENCDHTPYTPDLREALERTLAKPRGGEYYYAMGPKASGSELGAATESWLAENAPMVRWHDSEALLAASLRGQLYPFVRALSARRLVLVGPEYLARLPFPRPDAQVITPRLGAWGERERIARDVRRELHVTNPNRQPDAVLFCAGMTTKVLIWQLYQDLGARVTLCDLGSLFDVYCGVDSRRYARKMKPRQKERLLTANFGGATALGPQAAGVPR